ncbi:unnamed protein product [Diamesa hyperborea]
MNCGKNYLRNSKTAINTKSVHLKVTRDNDYLSEHLNADNSILMGVDLDLVLSHSVARTSVKRKPEDVLENNSKFIKPKCLKEKIDKVPVISIDENCTIISDDEQSQVFLENNHFSSIHQTQIQDCIADVLRKNTESTVHKNDVTCSQYVELKRIEKTVDELLEDDSLDQLFLDNLDDESFINKELDIKKESPKKPPKKSEFSNLFDSFTTDNLDLELLASFEDTGRNSTSPIKKDLRLNVSTPKVTSRSAVKKPQSSTSSRPRLAPVSSSGFCERGSFFGLPSKVKSLIQQHKGIDILYDWQEECLNLKAIHQRNNLIYALPTSGGKTLVAEILMLREVICRRRNVLLILPFVSIVQEKISDLTPFALELNFLVEEYAAGKGSIPPQKRRRKNTIFVSTIEKSMILFDSLFEIDRINEIGLIIVDELHMVGDPQRGYVLETLLSKTMFQSEIGIQIVGMSATISNISEVAEFLKADVYVRDFRPIELKEYVKIGADILTLNSKSELISNAFEMLRTVGENYDQKMLQRDPDHIQALVMEVIPEASCLIFCSTKVNCESVAQLLVDTLPKEILDHRLDEKESLMSAIKGDTGGNLCSILTKTIPFGVAYHHSGLTSDERKHLEEAYRLGIICVLCCTSTLAAGVNLPAKRVIIRSPYVGSEFLTLTRYKQMIGRAGRAGHTDHGESILLCSLKDSIKMTDLLCSKMDETVSAFIQNEDRILMKTVVLNCVGNKIANSLNTLKDFFKCTFLNVQSSRFDQNLNYLIIECVKNLANDGAISVDTCSNGTDNSIFSMTQHGERIDVYPCDNLEVSPLGKAAVKAGISLERAKKLYKNLKISQKAFVLADYLHLLYVVVPDDVIDLIKPDYQIYNSVFMKLKPILLHTANIIGISEANAMQMVTRPNFKGEKKYIIDKFYVALMLFELWNMREVHDVATKYKVNRGIVQKLMFSAAAQASCMLRFSESFEEFWAFTEMLGNFSKRLAYCCSTELLPLMELPAVKIGRAKQLFAANYRTLDDIAQAQPTELVQAIRNLNQRTAIQIIQAAKLSLIEKIDSYQDRVQEMLKVVNKS